LSSAPICRDHSWSHPGDLAEPAQTQQRQADTDREGVHEDGHRQHELTTR
jgi:hypothetical protein